jgi:hypothetical protein
MKNIAILSKYNTTYPQTFIKNNTDFNTLILNNCGNLVFVHAINNLIKNPKLYYNTSSLDEINQCKCLIVPAANWISSSLDMSGVINYIKNVKIPIVFLGLGVQAKNYEDKNFTLNQSSIDLINIIKSQDYIVCSRGQFTQEILEKHGVSSTIVGCTSNLLNQDPNLVDKLVKKWEQKSQFCVGVGNDINTKCPVNIKAEQLIFEWGTKYGFYLQQSYLSIINAIRSNNQYAESYNTKDVFNKIGTSCETYEEFNKLMTNNSRIYMSIDQWMEDMSRMDLCFGTRIHGNILATQSQCPSIVVYHDSRTRELAETMCYPRISVDDFVKTGSIDELKDKCVCDFSLYNKKRSELRQNLKNILSKFEVVIDE